MSSVSDLSNIITAGATVAGVLGGAISFLWARVEFTNRKTKQSLVKCEQREANSKERHLKQLTIIELLWQEIERLVPDALVLRRAKTLLNDMKHDEEATKLMRGPFGD